MNNKTTKIVLPDLYGFEQQDESKLDKIDLKQGQLKSLFNWRDKHKDLIYSAKSAILSGVIRVEDVYKLVFEEKGNNVLFKYLTNTEMLVRDGEFIMPLAFIWNKKTKNVTVVFDAVFSGVGNIEDVKAAYRQDLISSAISVRQSLMAYMEHTKDSPKYVHTDYEKVMKKKKGKRKNGKSNSRTRVSYVTNKVYSLDFASDDKIADNKREYNRHIESWGVRGHLRHLKSGKSIWINPYKKGTGRTESKIYRVESLNEEK